MNCIQKFKKTKTKNLLKKIHQRSWPVVRVSVKVVI